MKRLLVSTMMLMTLFVISAYSQKQASAEKAVSIAAGQYWYSSFTVQKGETADFALRFKATGGSGNDVEVYIMDADGFENWKNGHSASTYYNSGRKTVGSFDLKFGSGTYYFIISNTFSTVSNKAVTLTYYE